MDVRYRNEKTNTGSRVKAMASLDFRSHDGYARLEATGYGSDKEEARINLLGSLSTLVVKLINDPCS